MQDPRLKPQDQPSSLEPQASSLPSSLEPQASSPPSSLEPQASTLTPQTSSLKPLIIAHRGASSETPENTLAAFRRALELGCDLLELDIHLSRDGNIVVIHDETVERTTNGRGIVQEMTLDELRRLDAGSWYDSRFKGEKIPTLEEVIELVKPTAAGLLIEIKNGPFFPDEIENELLQIIRKHGMQSRAIVQSFDHRSVRKVKQLDPALATAVLIDHRPVDAAADAKAAGAQTLAIQWKFVTPEVVKEAHHSGLRVFVWTVNHPEVFRRLTELGVDGIITDYPKKKSQ